MILGFGGVVAGPQRELGWNVLLAAAGIAGVLLLTVKRLRWVIGIILCVAITNSYMDRLTLPIAVNAIRDSGDILIDDNAFADLNIYFLLTYGLMYVLGGKLMDALGTRWGFFWITIFWSLAVIGHGLASGFFVLAACRLFLGVGEGGGFPAITKGVAEWFPARERSTAIGLINAGTAFGGMMAPALIALVLTYDGWPSAPWRWVFFLSGSTGFVWCVWWMRYYYPASRHPRLGDGEREEIRDVIAARPDPLAPQGPAIPWLRLFTYPQVWGLMFCKFLGDGVWYFIAFWLPRFLMDDRGYDIRQVGYWAWIPWGAAGIGCLVVGSFSSLLIKRGLTVNAARKIAIGVAVSVMPCLMLVPYVPSVWVIVPFAIGYFGQQAWSTLIMTLPTDLFPHRAVGAVAGLVGFGGAMGGIVFNKISGLMLTAGTGYTPVFLLGGVLHIASFIVVLILIPRVEPLKVKTVA